MCKKGEVPSALNQQFLSKIRYSPSSNVRRMVLIPSSKKARASVVLRLKDDACNRSLRHYQVLDATWEKWSPNLHKGLIWKSWYFLSPLSSVDGVRQCTSRTYGSLQVSLMSIQNMKLQTSTCNFHEKPLEPCTLSATLRQF